MRVRPLLLLPAVLFAASAATAAPFALRTVPPHAPAAAAVPIDPRTNGLEITMGEWTLVSEAPAIRPGTVTLVITNRGKFGHGFRIRSRDREGDRVGKDRFEARTRVLAQGESTRLTVTLPAGVYDIECFVEDVHGDHEERGMHALLTVRADAPFVEPKPKPSPTKPLVDIAAFKYQPTPLTVKRGTTVKWTNRDAAKHTVSALNGSFTSRNLSKGQSYSRKFTRAAAIAYLCALHPEMRAKLIVR